MPGQRLRGVRRDEGIRGDFLELSGVLMVRSWMLTRGVLGKYTGRLREKCCSGGVREERGWWEGNWGIFFKVSRFWIARSWMLIRGVVKIYEKSL